MEPWGGHKVWRLRRLDLWGVSWFNCFHYHVPGAALIWAQTLSPAVQILLFELLYREPSLPVLSLAFSQCNRCSGWVRGQWASGWVSAVGMQKSACLSASRISAGKPSQPFPVTVSVHLFIQTECIDSQMQTRHGKESQHQRCPGNYLITHYIYIFKCSCLWAVNRTRSWACKVLFMDTVVPQAQQGSCPILCLYSLNTLGFCRIAINEL